MKGLATAFSLPEVAVKRVELLFDTLAGKVGAAVARNLSATLAAVFALGLAVPLAAPVFAACDVAEAKSTVSFSKTIEPLLDVTCAVAKCHVPINPMEELILQKDLAYHFLVNIKSLEATNLRIVDPGNPEGSYLLHKLRGTHIEAGGMGERMPFDLPPLTDDQIGMIATWIKDCSPRN